MSERKGKNKAQELAAGFGEKEPWLPHSFEASNLHDIGAQALMEAIALGELDRLKEILARPEGAWSVLGKRAQPLEMALAKGKKEAMCLGRFWDVSNAPEDKWFERAEEIIKKAGGSSSGEHGDGQWRCASVCGFMAGLSQNESVSEEHWVELAQRVFRGNGWWLLTPKGSDRPFARELARVGLAKMLQEQKEGKKEKKSIYADDSDTWSWEFKNMIDGTMRMGSWAVDEVCHGRKNEKGFGEKEAKALGENMREGIQEWIRAGWRQKNEDPKELEARLAQEVARRMGISMQFQLREKERWEKDARADKIPLLLALAVGFMGPGGDWAKAVQKGFKERLRDSDDGPWKALIEALLIEKEVKAPKGQSSGSLRM